MRYYVQRGLNEYGPYTLADLQRYIAQGNILLTDLTRSEGMSEWVPVAQVIGNIAVTPPSQTSVAYGRGNVQGGTGTIQGSAAAPAAQAVRETSTLSPRIRRLKLDHESLFKRLDGWPLIRIVGTSGMPPELYRFQYFIRGLYVAPDGTILERNEHLLEVNLSLGYPRRAPQCRMLTPVFHPNFDDSSVCIGDFWAASEALDDLIIRIGRMISYQEYNTKSPLNGLAAKWAAQHGNLLPVDPRPIAPPLDGAVAEQPAAPSQPSLSSTLPASPPEQAAPSSASRDEDPWNNKIVIS
jgi:ubiquitin-protein ligase